MSTLKYSPKKRPYFSGSCDESSDSDSEETPVKIRNFSGSFSHSVSVVQKLKKFFNYVIDFPVKEYFTKAMKMGSKTNMMYVDEDKSYSCSTNSRIDTGCKLKKGKSKDRRSFDRPKYKFKDNFVTLNSTYGSKSFIEKDEHSEDSESSAHQTINRNPFEIRSVPSSGSSSFWRSSCALDKQNSPILPRVSIKKIMKSKKIETLKEQAKLPFAECSNDVEIIFDSRNGKPAAESDDIEIVSEISSPRPNSSDFRLQHRKELSSYSNNFKNHAAAPVNTKNYIESKLDAFTAHQVVRMNEKDQYQLLLERFVSRPLYQPMVRKSLVSTEGKTSNKKEPCQRAFTKETLNQPITPFLQKYRKPCQLVLPTTADKSPKKEITNVIDVDDEEENVYVLPSKLPATRPPPEEKSPYLSPQWIANLKISVNEETEERMKIVREQEEELEKYRKRRAGLNAQERLKLDSLRIKGIVLPESGFDKDADFIELTPEMEAVIDYALVQADSSQVLSTKDGITIMRKDIETLSGANWLNDEVINYYLALIVERGMLDNYPSVHSFNSFFYVTLKSRGFSAIRRWTRKVDIFAFDINLVPLHLGVHWCLAVIDHRYKTIRYYDSMGSGEDQCLERLRDYLVQEKKDKKNEIMDRNSYTIEIMRDIPGQMNGCDCGMFTLKYAEYLSRDAEITFTQLNMQHFRRRMVYEIMKSQLL